MDKSWLLNRAALHLAKQCILEVEESLGFRLKLADPEFLLLLGDYAELLDSPKLKLSVARLFKYADLPCTFQLDGEKPASADVIELSGRSFPRYKEGKEFKNLYRGQPVYA